VNAPIQGAGGGKGGGGDVRIAQEAPNTLQSVATARIIDVVSEGEIEGLQDGLKGVYFDGTPVQNSDDSFNFNGVAISTRNGTPSQVPVEGFPNVETEVPVNLEFRNDTPLVETVTDANTDALRVKVRVPRLTDQNTTNGDLNGSEVEITIEVKESAGAFVLTRRDIIAGKTTSPYEKSYRVELPIGSGGAPWDIRVSRVTADDPPANIQNQTFWTSYTRLIDAKLEYPDSALVALTVDAKQFGNSIPQRGYDIKGIKLQLPDNYDPITRIYTGIWGGGFQVAWSDNPAWVLYDILTNNRYGLGESIDAPSVDKFSLYAISQYCDELIDDGFGGQEPRFTFNGTIASRAEAYEVVSAIASAFRGMIYWGSGAVVATQDSPTDATRLVAPANVIDGMFNYNGSGLKARHSAALVTWNDPQDGYKPGIVVVEDPTLIQLYSWRQVDVLAFGCTSKGQAFRLGNWILDSERFETETVTYRCSFDHADIRPGDVIDVADPTIAGVRFGGRTNLASTVNTINIDSAVTLSNAETYELSVVLPDDTIETQTLTALLSGDFTALPVQAPFSAVPLDGAMWTLSATDAAVRKFRIIAVVEIEENIYEVTGLLHDPTKYHPIDSGYFLEDPNFSILPTGPIGSPQSLSVEEFLYLSGVSVRSGATLSWTPADDPRVIRYQAAYKGPQDPDFIFLGETNGTSMDLLDTRVGQYDFRVRSITSLGQFSPFITFCFSIQSLLIPPADVTNFNIDVNETQTYLTWDPVLDLDLSHYIIKYSTRVTGATWGTSVTLAASISKGMNQFVVPTSAGSYLIKSVDTSGVESLNEATVTSETGGLRGLNLVETLIEEATFLGTKVDTVLNGALLQLDTSGGDVLPVGTYEFDNIADLGDVFGVRLVPDILVDGLNINNVMSSWTTLSEVETLSGADPGTWDLLVEVAVSDDGFFDDGVPEFIHNGTDTVYWTGSEPVGTKFKFNDGNRSFDGTKSVKQDNSSVGDIGQFTNPGGALDLTTYDDLYMQVNIDKDWDTESIEIYGYDTNLAAQVGAKVTLESYLNTSLEDVWQEVVIPLADLGLMLATTVDALRIEQATSGSGKKPKVYYDVIQWRQGPQPAVPAPVFGPYEPLIIGEKVGRSFKFKVTLFSFALNITPSISRLRMILDMPDRIESGQDLTALVGGTHITFVPAFLVVPAIAVDGQSVGSNHSYHQITNADETGFDVEFFDGGSVERTFDYIARGYGRLET